MVSPFSIGFSTICCTNAAYSCGFPSREGNGIVDGTIMLMKNLLTAFLYIAIQRPNLRESVYGKENYNNVA
jgi:hypothetical protein